MNKGLIVPAVVAAVAIAIRFFHPDGVYVMPQVSFDLHERATKAAGNWKKFDCFVWHDQPDDGEKWAIVYTSNRDSTLLDESNAAAIDKIMEPFTQGDNPDAISERHDHWAVGYVDGYAIRVFDDHGEVTAAFGQWCDIQDALERYPVLDEDDYSERESNATWKNVQDQTRYVAGKFDIEYTDELASNVNEWLVNNKPNSLESRDDQGGYPDDDDIEEALLGLGLLVEADDE